jgi:hypothetical protein
MKIRLEGSVRPRAYGRVIRDRGLVGRTQLGRPFWTMRCELVYPVLGMMRRLRELMAQRGLFTVSELAPLCAHMACGCRTRRSGGWSPAAPR